MTSSFAVTSHLTRTLRRLLVATVATTALAMMVSASPVSADPPVIFERNISPVGLDLENEYVIFINHSRETDCEYWGDFEEAFEAWLAGGMVGAEPEPPPPALLGLDPVTIQRPPDGGVTLGRASDLYVEIWSLDSEANRSGVGPCVDTNDDGQLVAVGHGEWMFHSNNVVGDPNRGVAVYLSLRADMTAVDGTEFSYLYQLRFNSHCHVADGAGPVCFAETGRFLGH